MPISRKSHRWAVVLAGGDGTRLRELTRLASGDARPKQFCRFLDDKSLLAHTRERIVPLFEEQQTLFALARAHEPYYVGDLSDVERRRRIVQPANRGTALAIAVCLRNIVREDPDAVVAFFPADHHYVNIPAFQTAVELALVAAEEYPHSALIIGAKPSYPEVEYGWIQPGRTLVHSLHNPLRRVSQFWEKPSVQDAERLAARGCLWNTFVTIGLACAFLDLLQATVPEVARLVEAPSLDRRLDEIYRAIPAVDFSKAVLSRTPRRLVVLEDAMSGWTDLGNPSRVIDVVARQASPPAWLATSAAFGPLHAGVVEGIPLHAESNA